MKNIAEFLYQLNQWGFSVWLENSALKYRQYKDHANKNAILDRIKDNKADIIKFLSTNGCNSCDLVNPQHIYISGNSQEVLSFAQERLWFIEKYEEGSNAYNIPMVYRLASHTKLDILEKSIRSVVSRHEILRTLIKEDNEGNGYQLVLDDIKHPLQINKVSVVDNLQLDLELKKQINQVYDLSKEYPIRVSIYELPKQDKGKPQTEYYLSVVIHHIAFDGWSVDIFLKELQECYNYYLDQSRGLEAKLNLPELSIQYKDFALWQRNYLSGERLDKQFCYWKNKLDGYEALNLITDKPRPTQIDYTGKDISFEIDEATSKSLRELAKKLKVSLYSLLLSGYLLMLRAYSNQDDIVIGTPVANRHYSQVENLIGFFVNSLALRAKIDSKMSVKEFIQKIGSEVIEAQLHQDLPFEKLVEELKVIKDTHRHPIFQVIFGVQSFGGEAYKQINEESTSTSNILQGYTTESNLYSIARFDISTFIDDSGSCLKGDINYAVSLYREETITRFIETYVEILRQFAALANDSQRLEQIKLFNLSYLNEQQYKQLICTYNHTDEGYSDNKTIHELFEEQVVKNPDSIAVVYEDQQVTYLQLNEMANRLADYLRSLDVGPGSLVGIGIYREIELIIGLIAILKTGAAYVPLDPEYPEERLKYMIEDSGIQILLVTIASKEKFNYYEKQFVYVDSSNPYPQLVKNSPIFLSPDNLAYIIYTSGSTGKPKGVINHHRGVINRLKWMWKEYPFKKNEVCCLQSSICFVDSTWDIFGTLLIGLPLVLYKPVLGRNVESFLHQCFLFRITRITLLPSFLEELIRLAQTNTNLFKMFKQIKHLEVTGEFFKSNIFLKFTRTFGHQITFLDCYGATEATSVIYKDFNQNGCKTKVISNTKVYILADYLSLVPIGAIGEVYIEGIGLAHGYFNKADLTAERFVANPFRTEEEVRQGKNSRLYKTGDLARYSPDGNLEYIGRNDFQVKIRGYRIELGEIETILASYTGIRQSVVVTKEHTDREGTINGSKYLVGYYVSAMKLDEESVLNYLQKKLPDYMVPSILVHLEHFPLTANGKLDRKALPDPEFTNSYNYIAPRNKLENKVCQIWAEVLSLDQDKIGVRDNFFRLGGNSILAIKLVSKINKDLNSSVTVSAIFKHNTVEQLSHYLEYSNDDSMMIDKAVVTCAEERVLSFAQERLWFIERYAEGTNAYNMPNVFKLSDNTKIDILEKSIRSIISRHEILRTLIQEDNEGNGYQLVLDEAQYPLEIKKISITDRLQLDQAINNSVNHIFDLGNEYPIRVCLYKLVSSNLKSNTEYYLSIVIHHIAFDGWSYVIFFRELQEYYNYYSNQSQGLDSSLNLPTLNIQYTDFALWQRRYLSGERLDKQLNYWKKKLNGYETLNLITDKARPSQIDYRGHYIHFELDENISLSLRELAKELKVSLYSLLLAGYYLMLRSYSNQDDIVLGTPIANRHYSQIENLIGFFVNTLALRIRIDSKDSIREFIQRVGQEILEAQLHQDLPFERLVEKLDLAKDTSRHPLFQVMFGVQGFGGEIHNKVSKQTTNSVTNLLQGYIAGASLHNIAKFDISTFIDDSETLLRGSFNYAINLYSETTVQRFIKTYIEILKQFAAIVHHSEKQEQTKISDLRYLTTEQCNQLIYTWNRTEKEYPNNKTIHQLFEEQVERTPGSTAVIYAKNQLTYKELNEKANQLANYLKQNYDIKPDSLIALCLDRSEYMLIAILAVLKAGGAYVPIDPGYPDDRIKYILKDSNANLVLTNEIYRQKLEDINKTNGTEQNAAKESSWHAKVLAINDDVLRKDLSVQLVTNPKIETTSTNIAYVIYTSGTTGNPKGVLQLHGNIMRLFTTTEEWYAFNNADIWTLFHSYVFDFSVWEIWGALIYGGKLVIPSYEQTRDPELFYELCQQEQITVLNQTPSAFYQFINLSITKDIKNKLTNLRYVIFGGEALNLSQLKPWFNYYGYKQPQLVNMYGITETTVHVTYKPIEEQDLGENSYIGKIIPDLKGYILDGKLTPLPLGAIGELYIGGVGLARGYLNRPELTAEKFIANPFQTEDERKQNNNARLYKTGDLVRWLADGELEYIGRNDFQVKLRGYRIELGEIEAALSKYDSIKQSVVLAKDHIDNKGNLTENKYLVAYYVKALNLEKIDTDDFIDTWEEVYQLEYLSLDITHFKQNFKGWLSSYTNEAIDKEGMVEWVKATTERIKELNPKVILEIGSGSGLIAFNMVDICDYYYATDFSKNAIDYANKVIDKFRFNNKISALSCTADELPYHKLERPYDTVIINSVIQYFPNIDYLEKVIIEAISNLKDFGQIFIGDIRDYRLLKCFHYSVQNYKHKKVTKAEVEYFVRREKELLISPEYFIHLKAINKFISYVEIMPKLGKAEHEMNNYRYDVILHICKNKENITKQIKKINESEFIKVIDFSNYFAANIGKDYIYIKYPNKRIVKDYVEYNALCNIELETNIEGAYNSIISIDEILEKVESKNYKAKFLLDIKDPLYLDIIIYKEHKELWEVNYNFRNKLLKSDLANNPLVASKLLANQFVKELREYLNSKLPEYMVPEYYIPLEKLPLTINGKLDRKALPDPEFTSSDCYIAPRNEIESRMCQIWAEVLGLDHDKIGIKDEFFRLGGNSILAIRLASKINGYYKAHLKVSDVFAHKNVELLLLRMLQTKDSYQTIVKLNNTYNKPNMFMIHPGIGGCEVYISLAHLLTNDFSCYGIDSYNLYHHDKIESLRELAKYYLSYIDKIMLETHQEAYYLLGWSMGGHIALEIACILEERGDTKIKVYLLDAVLYDDNLFSTLDYEVEETKKHFNEYAISEGYDALYIEKSLANMDSETKLSKQKMSSILASTHAVLFKAMLGDMRFKSDEYHNINKLFKNQANIKLVKVDNAHHGNILEQEELLVNEITKF